jgi:hypothetical protein
MGERPGQGPKTSGGPAFDMRALATEVDHLLEPGYKEPEEQQEENQCQKLKQVQQHSCAAAYDSHTAAAAAYESDDSAGGSDDNDEAATTGQTAATAATAVNSPGGADAALGRQAVASPTVPTVADSGGGGEVDSGAEGGGSGEDVHYASGAPTSRYHLRTRPVKCFHANLDQIFFVFKQLF